MFEVKRRIKANKNILRFKENIKTDLSFVKEINKLESVYFFQKVSNYHKM